MNKIKQLNELKIDYVYHGSAYDEIVNILINDLLCYVIKKCNDNNCDCCISKMNIDYRESARTIIGYSLFYRSKAYRNLIFNLNHFYESELEHFNFKDNYSIEGAIDSYVMCSLIKSVLDSKQIQQAMLITNE